MLNNDIRTHRARARTRVRQLCQTSRAYTGVHEQETDNVRACERFRDQYAYECEKFREQYAPAREAGTSCRVFAAHKTTDKGGRNIGTPIFFEPIKRIWDVGNKLQFNYVETLLTRPLPPTSRADARASRVFRLHKNKPSLWKDTGNARMRGKEA